MPGHDNPDRRRFLGAAVAMLAMHDRASSATASSDAGRHTPAGAAATGAGASRALGTPKQIAAGLLAVGYTDAGPAGGRVVILLHGWPYDVHSFVEVVPLLVAAGYRMIVPHLRGFGPTRFLSSDTVRNGQQAALALDVIALMTPWESTRPSSRASTGS